MQDNILKVALIVLLVFFLLFGGLGFYYMSQVGSKEKQGSLEAELSDKRERKAELLSSLAELEKEVEAEKIKVAEERVQQEVVKDHLGRLRISMQNFDSLQKIRKSHRENIEATRTRVASALDGDGGDEGPTVSALRGKKGEFEDRYQERRDKLQNTSDDITKELSKQKLRYERRFEDKRKMRDRLETSIVQMREELQKFMVRDLPEVDIGHDGIVLTVDVESRQAVINVGRRQGVRCGMRFEVFQFRQGNRRVHKGQLVVRSLGHETANCIIVDMALKLPRCPGDGYTARFPEERFCPYCAGSAGGSRVQRLSAIPKEANLGMDPENPIVAGDLIQNPLFESGKHLRFAVKGEADSPLSDKWKTEDFIAAIKWHGGVIDEELTAQADILLAGKYATDDARRARELGVQVLRQYEVFDFLRQ